MASASTAPAAAAAKPRAARMLFVSRLPYSINTDLLNEYFGDIGPLRKAFVVTDKESKKSKGVAYVQYALADDAERALETLGNKPIPGADGDSRPIRVEYARLTRDPTQEPPPGQGKRPLPSDIEGLKKNKKVKSEPPAVNREPKTEPRTEPKTGPKKEPKTEKHLAVKEEPGVSVTGNDSKFVPSLGPQPTPSLFGPAPHGEERALAQRTLILSGLRLCSPATDTKQLYKRVRKQGDVESVLYPAPGESADVAHIVFRTPNHAHLAVPKLDGHVFKGATLRCWLKARLDARRRLDSMVTNPETRSRRDAAALAVAQHCVLESITQLNLPHSSIRVPGQGPVDGMELLSHASGGGLASGRIEKRNRLIVRNLPFDITAEDLKAYFLPFGPLYHVDVPQVEKKVRVHKHSRHVDPEHPETNEALKQEDGGQVDQKGSSEAVTVKRESPSDDDQDDTKSDSDSEPDSVSEGSDSDGHEDAVSGSDASSDSDSQSNPNSARAEADVPSASTTSNTALKEEPKDDGLLSNPVHIKSEHDDNDDAIPHSDPTLAAAPPSASPEHETQSSGMSMRGRGFAFVWFVSYGDAERALEGMNGQAVQHGQAERVALQAAKNSGLGVVRRKAKNARDVVLRSAHEPRHISVAFALAKDEYEQLPRDAKDALSSHFKGDDVSDGEGEEENAKKTGSGAGTESGATTDTASRPPPPDEGTTLFVRNIPFSATEKDFAALFRHFGPMRYARLVVGSDKQPRGTGFVCFWDRDHADAVLALAKRIAAEADVEAGALTDKSKSTFGADAGAGKDRRQEQKDQPFSFSSVLTADASSGLAAPLTLQGRVLAVVPAMGRSDAAAVAADRVAARAKTDRRNTYLLREGVPFAHAPLASFVGEKDAEVRLQSFGLRKQQLGANAALYVSPTRLSVRRLPLWVGDVELRKLAQHALKAFDAEVKAGTRDGLAPAEEHAMGYDPSAKDGHPAPAGSSTSTSHPGGKGVQARVIRQKDRLDQLFASRGLGRSQGYGFVTLPSLPYALKVLRWLNANPAGLAKLAELHRADLEAQCKHLKSELKHPIPPTAEGREKRQDEEALYHRIEARIKEIDAEPGMLAKVGRGGSLLVEFSLENAVITRRHKERAAQLQAGNERKRARDAGQDGGNPNLEPLGESGSGRAGAGASGKRALYERKANLKIAGDKKARATRDGGSAPTTGTPSKDVGSIISRKRKEKKSKGRGAK